MPVDYSSQPYWEARLAKERLTGYEWLVPATAIIPVISSYGLANDRCTSDSRLQVLHFGCGSSSLGSDLQRALNSRVLVSDADYATAGLRPEDSSISAATRPLDRIVPLLDIDLLSLRSLQAHSPTEGWDVLIDKSTADAISCGPPCQIASHSPVLDQDPIEVLCDNLAHVTRPGGRWVSISYSSHRFEFLATLAVCKWRVLHKLPIKLLPTTTTGSHNIVYQPETGVWAWILERTQCP